ncbi:MAG: hypothetical protein GQ557_02555 [Mycoplasmataceae bacterium]|nr:hypothetical protein [Mycoplasmataceae bacterium]
MFKEFRIKTRKLYDSLDKKFIFLAFFALILPFAYSWLRLFWIISASADSYTMISFWSYLQALVECFTAFLILPLFTFSKNKQKKSFSIFSGVSFLVLILFFVMLSLFPWMIRQMTTQNSSSTLKELKIFLFLTMISMSMEIFVQYLLADIIVERNGLKATTTSVMIVLTSLLFDILFLSNISPFNYSIINITLSSVISSFLIIIVLSVFWFISYFKENNSITFNINEVKSYYKKGLVPGLNVLIGNFFYSFVTLNIINHMDPLHMNSWHMAGWMYWNIIFKITIILQYILIAERINNHNDFDSRFATYWFMIIDFVIFLILVPISGLLILPTVIDDQSWLRLSTTSAFLMAPFFLFMGMSNKLNTKFITEDKMHYMLYQIIFSTMIIELPIWILLLIGINVGYWQNMTIWMISVSLGFFISIFQFEYLERKSMNIEFAYLKRKQLNTIFVTKRYRSI